MIALGIVTHPKTFLFLWNLLFSIEEDEGEVGMPPIYIVASGADDYSDSQISEMNQFCLRTGGDVFLTRAVTWEVGAIDMLQKYLPKKFTEFVFLQDTWEFKEGMFPIFWKRMQARPDKTLWFTDNYQMYAAKFRREVLRKISPWEWPTSKQQAIQMEAKWSNAYNAAEEPWLLHKWGFMPDGIEQVEKCGRLNFRCENEYMIKWKGTNDTNLQSRLRAIDEEGKL